MVPRLTERLMESLEEEIMVMADLVGLYLPCIVRYEPHLILRRFKRAYLLQDLTIRRA